MTKPTVTYAHGLFDDLNSVTNWGSVTQVGIPDAALAVYYDDIFHLSGTLDAATDEYMYWTRTSLSVSTNLYPNYVIRWKTSAAANGLGAKVLATFTSGNQYLVGTSTVPVFDTVWHVTSGTLTADKTVSGITLYADDYPDSVASGTFWVDYDFVLLSKKFTFPAVGGKIDLELDNDYADLRPPGRTGGVTQYLGMNSPTIRLTGRMSSSSSWGTPLSEYLMRLAHEASTEPWQWFTSDLVNCKVTPRSFHVSQDASERTARLYEAVYRLYSRSGGGEGTWNDLQWLGV